MELKLVGTGAISGAERSACSLIDNKILIDCGNGILKTLTQQGVEIIDIQAVLITHLHADHFFDLPFLMLLRFVSNVKNNVKIYCPVGTEKIIEHLCDDYVSGKQGSYKLWKEKGQIEFFEFTKLSNEEIIKDYFATSYEVCHGEKKPAYGYVINNANKAVGFSGDTTYCESLEDIIKNSDVSVVDMFGRVTTPAHCGIDNIERLCEKYKNKIIVATHCTMPARVEVKNKNISNLIVPVDGQVMNV